MTEQRLEVADVFREYGAAYLDAFGAGTSAAQRRVLRDLARCRTAELGGHVEECDHCGHRRIAYNSCRNRHCPKCQATARAQWLEERAAELLPVEYFHVVFTLPDALGLLALQNPRVVYSRLFRAAAETLLQIARDPQHLGADIGFLAVLHTWGQTLQLHPHIHCVVPGGGIAPDGSRWIASRPGFFLPVRVLSRLFRGKFLASLASAFERGQLGFFGTQEALADARAFGLLLEDLRQKEWMVYAKPPFGGPERVLKYLARYTHRVAISNARLIKMEAEQVSFHWKDYAHGNEPKVMTLDALEFIRRFLLHVLPSGFVRIRHYGFLANRHRETKVHLCRMLLGAPTAPQAPTADEPIPERVVVTAVDAGQHCPVCNKGRMVVIEAVAPQRLDAASIGGPRVCSAHDTS
jgi:Putative transposase/Transposase zinc-binding domain